MADIKVKTVLRSIYSIDYSKVLLKNGDEFITEPTGMSDLAQYLRKNDMEQGVLISFIGYHNGIFYSTNGGGELFCDPSMLPEIATFGMDMVGLKKGFWYKVSVIGRSAGKSSVFTDNRKLQVIDGTRVIVLSADLKDVENDTEYSGFFRADSVECFLYFTLGKIVVKDIQITEVEIEGDVAIQSETLESTGSGVKRLKTYGMFSLSPKMPDGFAGRYIRLEKMAGYGLDLYYDVAENGYQLERSNTEDVFDEPFTNFGYDVSFNFDKVTSYGIFDHYAITAVSGDLSPNTFKQGYIGFVLLDSAGAKVKYSGDDRMTVTIYEVR